MMDKRPTGHFQRMAATVSEFPPDRQANLASSAPATTVLGAGSRDKSP
jgi:hypothetical protein